MRTRGPKYVAVLAVLHLILNLLFLKAVPRFYYDEAWHASLGYNLVSEGKMKMDIYDGFGGINIRCLQNQLVMPWVIGFFYKIGGFGIATTRLGSVMMGLITIIAVFKFCSRRFGTNQAFGIVFLAMIHPWFVEISRRARPEIYFTALTWMGLLLFFYSLQHHQIYTGFAAGLMAGLAALTHPAGLVLSLVIVVAFVTFYRNEKYFWQIFYLASVGFFLLMFVYLSYVYWCIQHPSVNLSTQMMLRAWKENYITGEIHRWRHFLHLPKGYPFVLIYGAAWLTAWFRNNKTEKFAAMIIITYALALPFTTINNTSRYLTPLIPFFSILLVRLIAYIWNKRLLENFSTWRIPKILCRGISVGIIGVYLLITISATSLMIVKLRNADLDNLLRRIAQTVPSDGRVVGDKVLWMGKNTFRYGPYPLTSPVATRKEVLMCCKRYNYDYAVRTAWSFNTSHGTASPPGNMPSFRTDQPVDVICRHFGTKIDEFRNPYFGPVEIYRLQWGKKP